MPSVACSVLAAPPRCRQPGDLRAWAMPRDRLGSPVPAQPDCVRLVADEDLERLAEEAGPMSTAASMLSELRFARSRDRQFFAFHVNEFFFVGTVPDARTEAELLALATLEDLDIERKLVL